MTASSERSRLRERAALKSGFVAILTRSGTSITTLVITPILARALGVDGYGVFVTLTLTASLLSLGDLGVSNGLVTRLSGNREGDGVAREAISSACAIVAATTVVGLLIAAAGALLLPWPSWAAAEGLSEFGLRLAAFCALAGAALLMTVNLGQKIELAHQRGHAAALWSGGALIVGGLAASGIALLTGDVVATTAAMALVPPFVLLVQTFLVLSRLSATTRPGRRYVTRAMVRQLIGRGSQFAGVALLGAAAFQLDTIIISAVLSSADAGQYSVAMRLFALVSVTAQIVCTQLWSAFADARRHGELDWALRTLRRGTLLITGAALLLAIFLVVFGQRIVDVWVGDEFYGGRQLFVAAAVWTVLSAAVAPLAFFLNGMDLVKPQLIAAIPMAIVNVGLSFWLVHVVGASGVLWASSISAGLISWVPLTIIGLRAARREMNEPVTQADEPFPDELGARPDLAGTTFDGTLEQGRP